MRDRYEAVATRLKHSIARDWIFVAAASITLGGGVGALAVGSSSLHTMVALAAEMPVIPPPSIILQIDDGDDVNTLDDSDLPAACSGQFAEQSETVSDSDCDCDDEADVDDENDQLDET
jgi:hypothetical protein